MKVSKSIPPPYLRLMHHHNTAIAVWHSQPFEVPVLDTGMRWALVRYRNPQGQPRTFSLLKNWQFRWWIAVPRYKRLQLAVRKLSEKRMPQVNATTPMPSVVAQVANELRNNLLRNDNTPHIAVHVQPNTQLNIVNLNLTLHAINDEPTLQYFHDTL